MEIKSFVATLGIGMATGAAVMLMIPKQSKVYRKANQVVDVMKDEITQAVSSMTKN